MSRSGEKEGEACYLSLCNSKISPAVYARCNFVVSVSLEVHIYLFDQRWSTNDTGEIPTSG